MTNENLVQNLEAVLFVNGEPMTIKKISGILNVDEKEIEEVINQLEEKLQDRGIRLSRKENSVALVTSPEASEFVKKIAEEEFDSALSKASQETLAMILYRGPISRQDIDYVRGVNSSFILRNLLIRGLIDRITPQAGRGFVYKPSFQLLQYLGVNKIEDLPEFGEFNKKIEEFANEMSSQEKQENSENVTG